MKCPTTNCPEILAVHSRRLYCYKCRAAMRYHADKRPAQILEYTANLNKRIYRVEHIALRAADQNEAVSVLRRTKKAARKAVRSNGARAHL